MALLRLAGEDPLLHIGFSIPATTRNPYIYL